MRTSQLRKLADDHGYSLLSHHIVQTLSQMDVGSMRDIVTFSNMFKQKYERINKIEITATDAQTEVNV